MSLALFFFKQKTAYELRISDWSSDVCSSDLFGDGAGMARIGVLRDAVDEDEGHAGLRPPNWRMIARTLPERIGAAPRDFSHRDGRVSLSTRAHRGSFDDAKASKGVGRIGRKSTRLNSSH